MKNPTVPRNEIIYYMQHLPPLIMKMKSRLISGLIFERKPNITIKLHNKVITYDLSNKYFWLGFYQMCKHFGMDENLFPVAIQNIIEGNGTLMMTNYDTHTHLPLADRSPADKIKEYAKGSITALRLYEPQTDSITITLLNQFTSKATKFKYTIRK